MRRRQFIESLVGLGVTWPALGLLGCGAGGAAPSGAVLSANDGDDGLHYLSGLDLATGLGFRVAVPLRGHAAAVHPSRDLAVLCARRPGDALYAVDLASGELVHTVQAAAGRHYLGHAVFDPAGERLYATENVFDDAPLPDLTPRDAVIGVYDPSDGFRRVAELPAHGVGAHQLAWHPDGALVVAVGGIYTHPASPRDKLNLDTMDPSLVAIDPTSGELAWRHRPVDPQLSVRHLDIASDGAVAVGMQYEGPSAAEVPLVAMARPGGAFEALEDPGGGFARFDHYIGSVALHRPSGAIAASSPLGGVVGVWRGDGRFAGYVDAADVSGLGAIAGGFVASTGTGELLVIDPGDLTVLHHTTSPGVRWDNHLVAID